MDDLQIIIYIVFIVLYLLSRALRKKKPVVGDDSHTQETPGSLSTSSESKPRKRPTTFEELLRELEGHPQETEEIKEEPQVHAEQEKEPVVEETAMIEESLHASPTVNPQWEKYMKEGGLQSLDETVDLDAQLRKRFDTYKISRKDNIHTASRYRELLRSRDSVKDAIILKEILDRKYF